MSSMTDSANANLEEGVLQVSVVSPHVAAAADSTARAKERLEIDFVFDPLATTLRVILEDMKGAIEEMGYILPLPSLLSYLMRVVPNNENVHLNYDGLFAVKEFYNVRLFEIPLVKRELLRQHHAAKIHPEHHRGARTVLVLSLEELAAPLEMSPTTTTGAPLASAPGAADAAIIVGDLTAANVNTLINNSMTMASATPFPHAPDDPVPSAALRAWQATTSVENTEEAAPQVNLPTTSASAATAHAGVETNHHSDPMAACDAAPRSTHLDVLSEPKEVAEYVQTRLGEEEAGAPRNGRWSPQQWDQSGTDGVEGHAERVSVEEKLRLRGEWLQRLRAETECLRRKTTQMQMDMREVQQFRAALVENLKKEVEELQRQEQARRQEVASSSQARERTQREQALRDGVSRLQQQLAMEKRKEEVLLSEIRQGTPTPDATPQRTSAKHAAPPPDTPTPTPTSRPSAPQYGASFNDTPTHLQWNETTFNANTATQDTTPMADKDPTHHNHNNVVHLGTVQSMLAKERESPVVKEAEGSPPSTRPPAPRDGAGQGESEATSFSERFQTMTDEERRELYRFSERLGKHCKPVSVTAVRKDGAARPTESHEIGVEVSKEETEHDQLSDQDCANLLRDVRHLRERMISHTDTSRSATTRTPTARASGEGGPRLGAPPAHALRGSAAWQEEDAVSGENKTNGMSAKKMN